MQTNNPTSLASPPENEPHTYEDGPFPLAIRLRAAKSWLAGASLRGTRDALDHEARFSHESVRRWAHQLGRHLTRHIQRDFVAVDETSLFLQDGREVYGWAAFDAVRFEVFLTWVTQGRSGVEAWLFFKNILRRAVNGPFVIVDAGVWYPWPLETLGLDWEVVAGAARNFVESFFGSVKNRLEKMRRRPGTWHSRASLEALLRCQAWWWNHTRT